MTRKAALVSAALGFAGIAFVLFVFITVDHSTARAEDRHMILFLWYASAALLLAGIASLPGRKQ